jgi:methyl-accepting chemotaxis protein
VASIFFKRRHLIVDRFQYRLVAISATHFGLALLVFLTALLLPLMLQLDDPAVDYLEKKRVADVLLFFNEQVWLPLGAVFLLLTVHSLFVSHRICGPLYRFRAVFKALGQGNLDVRANIRKHDYLQAEARAINDMIGSLQARIHDLAEQTELLAKGTDQLKEAMDAGAKTEARKALEAVTARVEGLRGRVASFVRQA